MAARQLSQAAAESSGAAAALALESGSSVLVLAAHTSQQSRFLDKEEAAVADTDELSSNWAGDFSPADGLLMTQVGVRATTLCSCLFCFVT